MGLVALGIGGTFRGSSAPEVSLCSQDIARVTGVRVPPEALRSESEPTLANNVVPARPHLSSQGALHRARDVTAASAERLLSAGSAAGATLVKDQQAFAGTCPHTLSCRMCPSMQLWHGAQ